MASKRARSTASAAAFATMLTVSAAWAEPSASDRETARSLMQEGRDLRDKADLKGALSRFKAADEIMHVPTTMLEVARTQVSLGMLIEARDTVATLRKTPAQPDDPQPFKDARLKAEELDSQVEGRVPSITVTVTGGAEGDTPAVSIDGASLPAGISNLPRKVDPGHHVVSAHAASGDAKEEIDVAEGDNKDVHLKILAGGTGPSDVEQPGADRAEGNVVHTPGPLTYAGFIAGGVGLVVGSVTGVMALSKASTVKGECANMKCPSGQPTSDLNSGNVLATLSTVSFAIAAAGAGVGIVSLILGHKPADGPTNPAPSDPDASPSSRDGAAAPAAPSGPSAAVHVTPWVGPTSAGLFGTF